MTRTSNKMGESEQWSAACLKMFLLILCLLVCTENTAAVSSLDDIISTLSEDVANSQVTKGSKLLPPISYYKQVGVYPSYIRLNFNSLPESAVLRDAVAFFDDNAFVTLWTTLILLEAQRFSKPPTPPSKSQLHLSLKAVSSYHDKNRPFEDGILVFWPQAYNGSTATWSCGPVNLGALAGDEQAFSGFVKRLLDDLGLGFLWKKIGSIQDVLNSMLDAFLIPADFDDTFVNLGLGAMLSSQKATFPHSHSQWIMNNSESQNVFSSLKKYAYRPFSPAFDSSTIDPRTYFYLREFLNSAQSSGRHNLSLVTTWVMNFSEDKVLYTKGVDMPFHLNNVDLTVTANVLYGITSAVLQQMFSPKIWFDEELQQIYNDSSSLIAWQIAHNFSGRPDLALTYYPSVYNFLWFVSRTVELLNSAASLPFPVLTEVRDVLTAAVRGPGTEYIYANAQHEEELVYFDEFLGDADKTLTGKPLRSADDRVMVTSMAVNILCYAWSENQRLIPSTPDKVRSHIAAAAQWLVKYSLSDKYKLFNVFFSGSVKAYTDLPYYYPANYAKFLNGTEMPNTAESVGFQAVVGVQGMISAKEYQELLQREHYGRKTPTDFHGYNSVEDTFPFWSSQPLTKASVLLALTQYRHYFAA